jgi:inhibitor of cysteine peptidase
VPNKDGYAMLVDEKFNDRTIEVTIGQTIEVHLPENPTTGFRWQLTSDGGPACVMIESQFIAPAGPPGKGGDHAWKFKAVRAGESDIELGYRRSWESSTGSSRTFKIHVKIGS